ncbi:hypothetical protein pneo_cds_1004 [Pandoravirus neocaledonia]|uniref:BTB domain containing protein n=1 Tax=Pandoravirus neocaledonia TaxID=2107708 RepID=A0A2U7UDS2_9VIRU|nr:hypothetical protein pneo_cds_1004 [Pandoravirus neocaledonia]AVK76611.1 hypothetical protein pneo_cds_1004 [Pandoravirus neocaledonia]
MDTITEGDEFAAAVRAGPYDCVLLLYEVTTAGSSAPEVPSPHRLGAHRTVLCRATYFEAFFRRTDPDSVETRGPDGERALYGIYTVKLPFAPEHAAAVIGALYGRATAMPADAVEIAAFLGVSRGLMRAITESAARQAISDGPTAVASLVGSVLGCGAVDGEIADRIAGRLLGLLDPCARQAIAPTHAMGDAFYRPGAYNEPLTTADDGLDWHVAYLGVDRLSSTKAEITSPGGVHFRVTIQKTSARDTAQYTCILVDCIGGDRRDRYARCDDYDCDTDSDDDDEHDDVRDSMLACRISLDAYHPVDGTGALSEDRTLSAQCYRSYKRATGRIPSPQCGEIVVSPSQFRRFRFRFDADDYEDEAHACTSDLTAFQVRVLLEKRP